MPYFTVGRSPFGACSDWNALPLPGACSLVEQGSTLVLLLDVCTVSHVFDVFSSLFLCIVNYCCFLPFQDADIVVILPPFFLLLNLI